MTSGLDVVLLDIDNDGVLDGVNDIETVLVTDSDGVGVGVLTDVNDGVGVCVLDGINGRKSVFGDIVDE